MAKIAILSFYSGQIDRGVETFVYELSKRLIPKHQVTVFQAGKIIQNQNVRTYQYNFKVKNQKSKENILTRFYLDSESLKILLFTLSTISKITKGKFDVIIPVNGGWQSLILRICSKLTGSKVLVTAHAGIGADDAWNIFTRPDVFVALTKEETEWARNISSEVNIQNIPNGVDLSKFNPKIKAKNIGLAKPIVVCSSALVPYKRIDMTIRAVAKTKDMSLLLLGDGVLSGQIDSLGKRLLGTRYLRLTPNYADMPSLYRTGDVFTLASKTEAFGISYLEAMACNLPVVTTNDGSRSEIVGNAGIMTEVTNAEKYAKDLQIAQKTKYRNIPYDQALKFSWNKIALKYSNLISQLAKN